MCHFLISLAVDRSISRNVTLDAIGMRTLDKLEGCTISATACDQEVVLIGKIYFRLAGG